MQTRLSLVALLLSCALLPACLVGSSTTTEESGRLVSADTLARVQPGESQDFVRSLLGEPTDKIQSSTGNVIWKWFYTSTTTKQGGVFLLASASNTSTEQRATYVEFADGLVIRTWHD